MKTLHAFTQFVVLVSLPLLLGGCGGKSINVEAVDNRGGVLYLKGSDAPYTGKVFGLYESGQKEVEVNYKDGKAEGLGVSWYENGKKKGEENIKNGKRDGLAVQWYENGKKKGEGNFKDGELVSAKYWNSKGERVDSLEEAEEE